MTIIHRASALLIAALLTACGGGDPEPLTSGEFVTTTTGGRADVAATELAVALPGPDVTLDAPAQVTVEIELDWQQSVAAPAAVSVYLTITDANSTPQSAGLVTMAATRWKSTHTVQLTLPAGVTTLSAQAHVVATDASGAPAPALAYFDGTATWRVTR